VVYVGHYTGNSALNYDYEYYSVPNYIRAYYGVPIPLSQYGYVNPPTGDMDVYVSRTNIKYAPNLLDYTPFGGGKFQTYVEIFVYIYKNNNEYVQIWERNTNEERRGINDRVVKGSFSNGSNYLENVITFSNGDRIDRYKIPDLSNSDKVVRVATCPKWKNETEVFCNQLVTVIKGTGGN
jgi:hypothetical protein